MKRIIIGVILACLSLIAPNRAQAQEAKAHAVLTLSFIRYIGWNDNSRQGDFVIGVLRDKAVASQLREHSAGKKFGFQDIVVKEFKSIDAIEKCQVLYCSDAASFCHYADKIKELAGKDALLITREEGATNKGSMINFVVREDKIFYATPHFSTMLNNYFLIVATTLSKKGDVMAKNSPPGERLAARGGGTRPDERKIKRHRL